MQAAIEGFRVSFQQQHVWRLQESGAELRVEAALLLTGGVRLDALRGALADLLERNEILRTTYHALPGVEVPLQVITEEHALDLRETEVEAREAAGVEDDLDLLIARELAVERGRPFDPRKGPLVRFVLLHLPEGDKVLLLTFSALCADALTVDNAVAQIAQGYARRVGAAADSEVSAEPVQYADFSEWQSSLEEELERGRAYWEGSGLSRWDGLVDPLRNYQHGVRGREPFRPAALAWSLGPAAAREAALLAEGLGTPVSTVILAAWFALLRRLGGAADLVVGVLVDGRPIPPLREALGLFARYVPVSCSLEESFGLLDAVRVASLALQDSAAHQQAFAPEVDPAVPFPVLFDARDLPEDRAAGEVRFSLLREEVTLDRAKARLSLAEHGGAIRLELRYDPAFYTPEDAELLRERFETLLRQALAEPARPLGELPVLSERERRQVLVEWNATARDTPWTGPFHRLFERQAERTPEGVALVAGSVELTYRELERRANQLARHLRRSGVGLDDRVALCFDRSPELIVGALATLKTGAAFVPLDPLQPQERLRFMLEDVEAAAVLARQPMPALPASGPPLLALDSLAAELARESEEPLGSGDGDSAPEALAYAIFTSGSTGRPKAVLIRQSSVVNLLTALDEAVYQGLEGPLRVSLNAPLSFDAAIKQLIQLARGRTLCFVPEEIRADGTALLSFLRSRRIEVLDCTPTQLRLLLDAGLSGPGLPRLLLVGGEAIDSGLWQTLAADPHRRYVNVYGPTECTVDATAFRVVPGPATIGVPLANVRAYVLDS
ncbi:MAG TPA: AMP-binding protein, partial [Thermoanaerobaculia bacterium]|nr:AMP-binding protein [Thermoanaerobaculia bacterium]